MTSVWVILPTYDERENLPVVVARTQAALASCEPPVAPARTLATRPRSRHR